VAEKPTASTWNKDNKVTWNGPPVKRPKGKGR
jgi:hypothetical protein